MASRGRFGRCPGAFLLLLLAVSWRVPAAGAQSVCPVSLQNLYVRDVMTDLYLWYNAIPDVDPTTFNSAEEYLDAIRYRPLDSHYSYIDDRAASEAFFSNSQFIGFGFSSSLGSTAIRISQVFAASPAEEAGLERGDRIIAVDGRTIPDLISAGLIGTAFGPSTAGVERQIVVTRGGTERSARMVKRAVTIPTVSATRTFRVGSRTVGYIFFRNFVEPSFAALDAAFAELEAQGANELILDLRYNGGGLVSVAQYLAGLIGGTRTHGQLLGTYVHNDKHASANTELRMRAETHSLSLDRLVVIATGSSASASELIVNGLRPFMPVAIIGDRTYGKPVGQYAIPFCDKVLAPVAFAIRNANDEGDYFDGLPETCRAADDLGHQLGDPGEASLREAMTFIATGACSPSAAPAPSAARLRTRSRPDIGMGTKALIQAH